MKSIRLMNWNVLYKEKADNILSLVKEIKPDILCCQEITVDSSMNPGRDVPAEISSFIGNYRYKQVLSELEEKPGNMGNAIFSKFPIVRDMSFFVQKAGSHIKEEDYSAQNRLYLEVDLQIDGEVVTVGTTHLSYTPGFVETEPRKKEAERLFRHINNYKSSYLITGDFNAAPDSGIIRKIRTFLESAGPPHDQNTFSTKPFSHGGFSVNDLEWRLDYIFTSPDIKVLSSEIIKTDFSDHLPIVAEIEL